MHKLLSALRSLLIIVFTFATPLTAERLLVPISVHSVRGAMGSIWESEVTLANISDRQLEVRPAACEFEFGCSPKMTLKAGQIAVGVPVIRALGADLPGILLYVDDARAADLVATSRIFDRSRNAQMWGTTIPVVREKDFLRSSTNLVPIPLDPERFRVRLRIYDVDARPQREFVVKAYSSDGARLAEIIVRTINQRGVEAEPTRPGAYDASLLEMFPSLPRTGVVRLEVSPIQTDTRYWTFVSITNNETQHVTIVTP